MRIKVHYDTSYVTSNATGLYTEIQLRGNSLYDPEVTIGGSQPYSFAAWSAFYRKYRVHGSSVRVTAYPTGGTIIANTTQIILLPTSNSSDASGVAVDVVTQMPYAKNSISNAFKGQSTLSSYMSTRKMFGIDKPQFGREVYEGFVSGDPTTQWYWNILAGPITSGQVTAMVYKVRITYYAELYERKVTP